MCIASVHLLCKASTTLVSIPTHIHCQEDLKYLFQPLLEHIKQVRSRREKEDTVINYPGTPETSTEEQFTQVGAKVKIKWTDTELGGSGWKPGWVLYGNSTLVL